MKGLEVCCRASFFRHKSLLQPPISVCGKRGGTYPKCEAPCGPFWFLVPDPVFLDDAAKHFSNGSALSVAGVSFFCIK